MIDRLFDPWVRNEVPMPPRLSARSVPLLAALIGVVRVLDLDHVGAEHRQLISREGAGQHMGDVDDSDALKGSGHGGLLG